jgi:hypothetical protein
MARVSAVIAVLPKKTPAGVPGRRRASLHVGRPALAADITPARQAAYTADPVATVREVRMFYKLVAVTLFVSFIAMSTSGLLMFFIERPSFTIQMHPVHKLFGLIMVAAMTAHIALNFRALRNYVRARAVALTGGVLVALLVVLYAVAINNKLPPEIAEPLDALGAQAE